MNIRTKKLVSSRLALLLLLTTVLWSSLRTRKRAHAMTIRGRPSICIGEATPHSDYSMCEREREYGCHCRRAVGSRWVRCKRCMCASVHP
eukprot:3123959-Prymnesium_polylepis.3